MLQIDVLTAYAICGVGALGGAAMLRTVESPDHRTAAGLRLCVGALVSVGIGVGHVTFVATVGPISQLAIVTSMAVASVLLAWGIGRLAGGPLPERGLTPLLALAVVGPIVGLAVGELATVSAVVLAILSLLIAVMARRYSAASGELAARLVELALLAYVVSSTFRVGWALRYDGPPLPHLLHMPEAATSVYGLLYGVLPIAVATLLLSLINTQFAHRLREQAATDELTGLLTRRALRDVAGEHIARRSTCEHELALVLLDLDRFKPINDRHGHAVGDEVLREAAAVLRRELHPRTPLSRYGGEEFVAIMPVEDVHDARAVAEQLRVAIADTPWHETAGVELTMTVSAGVTLIAADESLDDALHRADEALYRAKREGRNQVQVGIGVA